MFLSKTGKIFLHTIFSKINLCRIFKNKIIHNTPPFRSYYQFHPLHIPFYRLSPNSFTHEVTSSFDAPEEKRLPSCQSPLPACFSKSFPLSPIPDEVHVQYGITVFPLKSFNCTKPLTGHAAIPHQIGYPMKMVS